MEEDNKSKNYAYIMAERKSSTIFSKTFVSCNMPESRWTTLGTERDIMSIMTKLKFLGVSPHLPHFESETFNKKFVSLNMSHCGEPLKNLLPKLSEEVLFNVMFQVVYTLYAIFKILPTFRHNDLHTNNIVLEQSDKYFEDFYYEIEGRMFKLPGVGYRAHIIDFGWSNIKNLVENMHVYDAQGDELGISPEENHCADLCTLFWWLLDCLDGEEFECDMSKLMAPYLNLPESVFGERYLNSWKTCSFLRFDENFFTPKTLFEDDCVFNKFLHSGSLPPKSKVFTAEINKEEFLKSINLSPISVRVPAIEMSNGSVLPYMSDNPRLDSPKITKISEKILNEIVANVDHLEYNPISDKMNKLYGSKIRMLRRKLLDKCLAEIIIPRLMEKQFYRICVDISVHKYTKEKIVPFNSDETCLSERSMSMLTLQLTLLVRKIYNKIVH